MQRLLIPRPARPPVPPRGALRRLAGRSMGTGWSVHLIDPGDTPEAALRQGVQDTLDAVVTEMSAWAPASALSRFNDAAGGSWHALPEGLAEVLRCGQQVAMESGGAFDLSIGALAELWGFCHRPVPPGLPEGTLLAMARACGGRLRFDAAGRLLQPGGLRLDVCGIGKGHGVDRVARHLAAQGFSSFLVEVGGELRGQGVKPDGTPWWVALERPDGAEGFTLALLDQAVATSGDSRRAFTVNGKEYSHTLDPRCGWPVGPQLASVSVLDASAMRADARATALTVLGLRAGLALATRLRIPALFTERAGDGLREHLSPALREMAA
ncbi:FAD:protein FMN transferase [Roseomonas sp. 18066]|uniref:FAD:protein FMN transferase n=1 Tax=Roseomonas sp. 18066 TaxID=2681412 RepID=UPI00135A9B49|nr:FAD:protein FMN transferase [Roseomonas sp. 18066]